mmetsp:Transcript_74607/g.103695  ORF Transcript_74607/g.103695 Transcript_74607/m.103695 type:complete len:217 (+) Transcript_74607:68-718(+)
MSKLNNEIVAEAVAIIFKLSAEKKRNFQETVELQIGLKNYDPSKDKRFAGTIVLPNECKRKLRVCVLGNQIDCDKAQALGLPWMGVEEMKALKKNKKKVKALAKQYDAFVASSTLIRKIPRLLGPGLNKAGKFPSILDKDVDLAAKMQELRSSVKFQLKKVVCLSVPVGDLGLTEEQVTANVIVAVNFLVSMLKKHWQNLKSVNIKSTMGPPQRIF